MPSTLATASHLTKEVWGPKVINTLNEEQVLSKRMGQTSDGTGSDPGGRYVRFPLRIRRNHGIGYRKENEKLQRAGQQGYISAFVRLAYGYGRIHMTGPAMDLIDSDPRAFVNNLQREMSGMKDDIAKDVNRVMYGDGSGVLATVTDNTITTTATVNNIQYLEEGMQVDVINPSTNTVTLYDVQIVEIEDNGNIELSTDFGGVADAAVGHILVRTGNYMREPFGLATLVDDTGNLFGVDSATERKWRAVVDENGGTPRPLSEGLMINMCDRIRRQGVGKPSAIFSDFASRRAYFNLLSQQRRYNDPKKYDGGLVGLAFNYGTEIPFVEDVDAPAGKLWFLDESSFKLYRDKDWHWEDRDGSVWKWVVDYDAFQALLKKYWQFGVNARNANGLLGDIAAG